MVTVHMGCARHLLPRRAARLPCEPGGRRPARAAAAHDHARQMPSSQTFVQATLGSAATERMSALYLPQYAAAMITVTLATGMGMALV